MPELYIYKQRTQQNDRGFVALGGRNGGWWPPGMAAPARSAPKAAQRARRISYKREHNFLVYFFRKSN